MKVNVLYPEIYEIEDFVTVEQQEKILEYCANLKDSEWVSDDQYVSDFFKNKIKSINQLDALTEIDKKIETLVNDCFMLHPITLIRHVENDFMFPHTDHHEDNEQANETKTYARYGLVVYYNDDYQGGELVYPNLGIVHKPKARSLVIHSGKHLHGTTRVVGNPRYCSTTFFIGNKEHHPELNKSIFGNIPIDKDYSNY
jgi:predicted 2-oxoglutarate/Fe(II)-dependent dioxygenase YbiX